MELTVRGFWQQDGTAEMIFLQLHPRVLSGFVTGTITSEAARDREFEILIGRHHKPDMKPCGYNMVICRAKVVQCRKAGDNLTESALLADRFHGYGYTLDELAVIYDLLERYIDYENQDTDDFAEMVDSIVAYNKTVVPKKCLRKRKFLPSLQAVEVIRYTIIQGRQTITRARLLLTPEQAKHPLRFCSQGFGWASEGLVRGIQHISQSSTNFKLGLFYSVTWVAYPGVFDLVQHSMCLVPQSSNADACEILCSIVGGTYSFDGWNGLNPALAGRLSKRGPGAINRARIQPGWEAARQDLDGRQWDEIARIYAKRSISWQNTINGLDQVRNLRNAIQDLELNCQLESEQCSQAQEQLQQQKDQRNGPLNHLTESAARRQVLVRQIAEARESSTIIPDQLGAEGTVIDDDQSGPRKRQRW